MATSVNTTIEACLSDKQVRILWRIFQLPKLEGSTMQSHIDIDCDLFKGFGLDLGSLHLHNELRIHQDDGWEADVNHVIELSEILGDTELTIITYNEGDSNPYQIPITLIWIDGYVYTEEEMYRNKMKHVLTDNSIYGIICRYQQVVNAMWDEETIHILGRQIKDHYKIT